MDQRWSDVCVVAPQDHFRALPAVSLRGGPVQSTIPLPQLQLTAEALLASLDVSRDRELIRVKV